MKKAHQIYWPTRHVRGNRQSKFTVIHIIVPSGVSPLKYWPHSFLPRPPEKILDLSNPPPPFISNPPQNFGEPDYPLEMYSCPKNWTLRFYFQQWNKNTFERLNMNIQLQNLKNQRMVRLSLNILFLLGS